MECVKCINTLLLLMCKSQINMCVYHADNSLLRKIYWTDITSFRYSHDVQYHFTSWPDHRVPKFATSLISFIRRVQKAHNKDEGVPLLVHCSAGVGRTGTFILLDSMLERIKAEKTVNMYEFLVGLRNPQKLRCRDWVAEDCCMLSFLLTVPSCIYSFWHGVIPTSYFIFTLVSLIFLSRLRLAWRDAIHSIVSRATRTRIGLGLSTLC